MTTSLTAIHSNQAPQAIGPYSQAIQCERSKLLFLSGQIPIDPHTHTIAGEGVKEQTRQVMTNLAAVLEASGTTFQQVLKTTIYLTDMAHFEEVNSVYCEYFTEPYPARVTIAVKELPRQVLVEIDATCQL